MQVTPEQIQLAQSCKSADELVVKAKEVGFDITAAEAAMFLNHQGNCDVSLEDLDAVAGGAGCWLFAGKTCEHCGSTNLSLTKTESENNKIWCVYTCSDCQKSTRIEA